MLLRSRLRPLLALCLVLVSVASVTARADEVRLLETDFEAAAARAEMLLDARDEILASYFLIGDDPLSLTALSMLRDAARRGVQVRLLVDDQWNKIPPAVQAHLLAEGIELRTYHPFRWRRLSWISRRMHDKLMVVDGHGLLAGGRNIESPYFGLGPQQLGRRNYIDCDVQVRGATAALARDYFLALWNSRHVDRVRVPASAAGVADRAEVAQRLDGHKAWMDARISAVRSAPVPVLEPFVPVESVRFLHDPVGRKGKAPGVGHELLAMMNAAEESVIIESPYLVPSRAFIRGLRKARERGLRVRILTNSLSTTDNLFPQAGYVGHKKWLVAHGVELWEATGPECLHSKTAVIDGRRAIVGSFNLDPRSEHLNTELALVLESRPVAETLLASMDAHLAHAVRIDARGMPEGAAERYPGVPRSKVLRLNLLRLLAPLIKKQL